jgi:putative acetyltransferase
MSLSIRPEGPADFQAISDLVTAAFGQADEARIIEEIRRSPHYVPELALVAEEAAHIVGQALFSYIALNGDAPTQVLGLAPVAVAPAHQRRGIGTALIKHGLLEADRRGDALVVVVGHPHYYPRFGFEPASHHGIHPPWPNIPDAAFMVKLLSGYEKSHRGWISYPPAFEISS